jgi:hypothetical protein
MNQLPEMHLALDMPDMAAFPKIITATIEGILELADLRALALSSGMEMHSQQELPKAAKEDPKSLKKLREKHHSVARLIAAGLEQRTVATLSGYTEGYLSILLNNPAMEELVSFYRMAAGNAAQVIGERLRSVGLKALEHLDDKIEGGELNANELIQATKLGLDRSGHGPSSTTRKVDEQHIIDHARILELNEKAREGSRGYIVPVDKVRGTLLLQAARDAVQEQPK